MSIADYTYLITNTLTDEPVEELPLYNVTYAKGRNVPGSLTASIFVRDPKCVYSNLEPVRRTINVLRNGLVVWSGPIWSLKANSLFGQEVVTIAAEGWFSHWLENRRNFVTDQFWADFDPVNVANQMVRYAQDATVFGSPDVNLNIQYDSTASTHGIVAVDDLEIIAPSDSDSPDFRCVGDELTKLANSGFTEEGVFQGFEFVIDIDYNGIEFTKRFRAQYPTISRTDAPVVTIDYDSAGVSREGLSVDGKKFSRWSHITTAGQILAESRSTLQDGLFPFVERVVKNNDPVTDQSIVDNLARWDSQYYKVPFKTPIAEITDLDSIPVWGLYPGDLVALAGGSDFFQTTVNDQVRIESWSINVGESGTEKAIVQGLDQGVVTES